jgi:hypothetical protein
MGSACALARRAAGEHRSRARPEEESVATFKLQVNLVDMFFTVKDKQGNLVPHLNQGRLHGSRRQGAAEAEDFVAETAPAADAGHSARHIGQPVPGAAAGAG